MDYLARGKRYDDSDMIASAVSDDTIRRFFAKVQVSADEDCCWEWVGGKSRGYGKFRVNGRLRQAHRFAYVLFNGPLPEGTEPDHTCRNRGCVNPSHVEPVSQSVNRIRALPFLGEPKPKDYNPPSGKYKPKKRKERKPVSSMPQPKTESQLTAYQKRWRNGPK
jgi:hypothetical protein